jgi:hypothetical protein
MNSSTDPVTQTSAATCAEDVSTAQAITAGPVRAVNPDDALEAIALARRQVDPVATSHQGWLSHRFGKCHGPLLETAAADAASEQPTRHESEAARAISASLLRISGKARFKIARRPGVCQPSGRVSRQGAGEETY